MELNAVNHRNDVMQLLVENDVEREKNLARSVVENGKENERQVENADKIKQVISLRVSLLVFIVLHFCFGFLLRLLS